VATVDADDDLRADAQPWRVAAGEIKRRLAIIRGVKIRRQDEIEGGAKQAA